MGPFPHAEPAATITPRTYYERIDIWVPGHGQDLARLETSGIFQRTAAA